MTPETQDAVFDILVEECGAPMIMREEFKLNWPQCGEYRFQGRLGFGGKVWAPANGRSPTVTCYLEDRNPERRGRIWRANERLFQLWDKW